MRKCTSKLNHPTRLLPLLCVTPENWATVALCQSLQLLNDHAHLERKAASNALDLVSAWPHSKTPARWTRVLSGIARDEVQHLARVVRILERRGGAMSRGHKNQYAQDLRALVRRGEGPREVADKLMVSALIEARSCERFKLLAESAADTELQKLYRALWTAEHGHYRVFLELAGLILPEKEHALRWEELLHKEAKIIARQPSGARMHSWA